MVFLIDLKLDRQANTFIYLIICTVIILFVGLRGNIEPDYENYLYIYNHSSSLNYNDFEVEPLYLFINKFVGSFGGSFGIIVLLMSVLSIIPKFIFFKRYSVNFALSIIVFYCSSLFLFDFIATRQAVAIGLFLYSLQYIEKRKPRQYFLIIFLAYLFHISALILIPCYFILNKRFSKKLLYVTVVLIAILNLLQINIHLLSNILGLLPLPGATEAKLLIYSSESEFAFISVKQIILAFLFVYINNDEKIKDNTKDNNMLNIGVNIYIIGIVMGTLLNEIPQFSYRIKWYFFTIEAFLIPFLILNLSRNQPIFKYCLYIIFVLIYGYYLSVFFESLASRGAYIFPYKFFFE